MKYVIVVSEGNYPSIFVVGSVVEAELVYKALTEGYMDWGDEWRPPVDAPVAAFEVKDTSLKTVDWAYIECSPLKDKVAFL